MKHNGTCAFWLQGKCSSSDNCPFPHRKGVKPGWKYTAPKDDAVNAAKGSEAETAKKGKQENARVATEASSSSEEQVLSTGDPFLATPIASDEDPLQY